MDAFFDHLGWLTVEQCGGALDQSLSLSVPRPRTDASTDRRCCG